MSEPIAFDHIHLISRDAKAAADWYRDDSDEGIVSCDRRQLAVTC